ncbi:MAG: hypothetical protein KDB03_26160 [Planctomycetales bacterium]|nr:hypothetical protein [Planctomycetales bacterium]
MKPVILPTVWIISFLISAEYVSAQVTADLAANNGLDKKPIEHEVFQFGKVLLLTAPTVIEGTQLDWTIDVFNKTGADWEMTTATKSCSCLDIEGLGGVVAAGEKLRFTVATKPPSGGYLQEIELIGTVVTNQGKKPVSLVSIRIRGAARSPIRVENSQIFLPEDGQPARLTLITASDQVIVDAASIHLGSPALKITGIQSEPGRILVDFGLNDAQHRPTRDFPSSITTSFRYGEKDFALEDQLQLIVSKRLEISPSIIELRSSGNTAMGSFILRDYSGAHAGWLQYWKPEGPEMVPLLRTLNEEVTCALIRTTDTGIQIVDPDIIEGYQYIGKNVHRIHTVATILEPQIEEDLFLLWHRKSDGLLR